MKLTILSIALGQAYGIMRPCIHSAAWLWFDWTRDKLRRPVSFRWKF
jgi:hypothetical protein